MPRARTTAMRHFRLSRVRDRSAQECRGHCEHCRAGVRVFLLPVFLALAACAATQQPDAVAPTAPGFLLGLWHGFIFPVAWVVSLFTNKVAIYAVPNDGGWYDFGYFLGIVVFGVGARKTQVVTRDNVINARAKRVD